MLSIRSLFACLALAFAGAPALGVNLVANGGFEMGNFSFWSVQPAASGSAFSVTGGAAAHTGSFGAAFTADASQFDQISQNILTTPGSAYTITFWVFNTVSGNDSLFVRWNGTLIYNFPPSPGAWTQVNLVVAAAGATSELRFQAFDGPGFLYLDDISVDSGNLIANPGFETGDFAGWSTQNAAAGSAYGVTSPGHGGARSALFNANNGLPDQIWQNIPTSPGRAYILQFWVNNFAQGGDSLGVFWEGAQVYDGTPPPETVSGWVMLSFIVVSTGPSSELRFAAYDGPNALSIDDVFLAAPTTGFCALQGDADRSGTVNFADITSVLTFWNFSCAP